MAAVPLSGLVGHVSRQLGLRGEDGTPKRAPGGELRRRQLVCGLNSNRQEE
jgi:hypothetical protein